MQLPGEGQLPTRSSINGQKKRRLGYVDCPCQKTMEPIAIDESWLAVSRDATIAYANWCTIVIGGVVCCGNLLDRFSYPMDPAKVPCAHTAEARSLLCSSVYSHATHDS